MVKIDLAELLRRRRVSVVRWLEANAITTQHDYENWKEDNSVEYTFSVTLDNQVADLLPLSFIPSIEEVAETVSDFEKELVNLPDSIEEAPLPQAVDPKKNKKPKDKKQVQTDESDE